MSKEIIVKLRIDDKGNIKEVGRQADKTSKSLDNFSESAHNTDRRLKGASQQSSNTTKNFSKMAQGITGGLVPAYATLAANIFAISAVFRFLQQAADFRVMTEGQLEFAQKTGTSLSLLTKQVQLATQGQLAFAEASQAVAIGRAAGLTADQLTEIAEIATKASIALGRDLTDSFNRLTRGAIKAEPELLDELGIIVRLNDATREYAKTLNMNANDLNTFQKSQAVVNAVITQGNEKFEDMNTSVNAFTRLAKTFDDVVNSIKAFLSPLEGLATALSKNAYAVGGILGLFGTGLVGALTPKARQFDASALRQEGIGKVDKFYSGKMLEDFQAGTATDNMLRTLERSIKAQSSKVVEFNQMSRSEALKTVRQIKAANALIVADSATGFKKMSATFKAELLIMQADYGAFSGFMAFTGRKILQGFNLLLRGAGIAGAVVSVFGIMQSVVDSFKSDEAKEFEAALDRSNTIINTQVEELRKLDDGLKEATNSMGALTQASNFISNISFKGLGQAFTGVGKEENFLIGLGRELLGSFQFLNELTGGATSKIVVPEEQQNIMNQSIQLLGRMRQEFVTTSDAFDEVNDRYITLGRLQQEYNAAANLGNVELAKMKATEIGDFFFELATKGIGPAVEQAKQFSAAINQINQSYTSFTTALTRMQAPQSQLGGLIGNLDMINGALEVAASSAGDFVKNTMTGLDSIADQNFINIAKNLIGDDQINAFIEQGGTVQQFLQLVYTESIRYADHLRQIEQNRLLLQNQINSTYKSFSAITTPLQKKELDREKQIADLKLKISLAQDIMATKIRNNVKLQEGELLLHEQFIGQLQQEIYLLEQMATLAERIASSFRDSFEKGTTDAFTSLIKGERPEEGRTVKFAKGIADSLTGRIASEMSRGVSNFIFGPSGAPEEIFKNAVDDFASSVDELTGKKSGFATIEGEKPDSFFEPFERIKSGGLYKFLFGQEERVGELKATDDVSEAMLGMADMIPGTGNFLQRLFGSNEFGKGVFGKLFGGDFGGAFSSFFGLAKGGIMGYSTGGVARQPTYIVGEGKQHEAVVPLPDNRSIPVDLKGGTGTNNVNVNVDMGSGNVQTTSEDDGFLLGQAISAAVVKEIERQQRPGGQLSSI